MGVVLQCVAIAVLCVASICACAEAPFVTRPDLIRLDDLEVQLVDPTGLAQQLLPVPESMGGPFMNGIEPVDGAPSDVIVPWVGGDCDVQTTLTLGQGGAGLVLSVRSISQPPPGTLCTLGGRLRAVVVRFRGIAPNLTLDPGP